MEPALRTFQVICLKCGSEDIDLCVRSLMDDEVRFRCIKCGNVEDSVRKDLAW